MPFKIAEARKELQAFDLKKLFIEQMGWDNPGADITIQFNGESLQLKAIAQKRGLGAFVVPPIEGEIPDYANRRKIEVEVRKRIQEHVLIFTNADESFLRWQWVRREPNKPTTAREFEFGKGQSGEALLQRLEKMYFSLEDEEVLSGITDATSRVRSAFDVEKVTKKFYVRFKKEHDAFLKFIKGIPDKEMQRWYVSVTLNRLMFIYFIQKKEFLNNDPDYLRNHLNKSKEKGRDLFYGDFLCPLFFEGFAKKERTARVKKMFGNIPYLNGGIFEQHQIEELHGKKIEIPDKAFEKLFDFFDGYRWHLDERPLKEGDEINPDVLGYIFEKYINQKQMGAYYTKEDITEYISKNTIIPHLFDVAQKECKIAFEGDGSVWRHLQADPDRYIYDAVKHGISVDIREKPPKKFEASMHLPTEISVGESDPKRREMWNTSAPEDFALLTEIWREVVARRHHYQEVKEKLESGAVRSINDLITLNLDIRQFAQDVIEDSEADLLAAFWKALSQIKILDPTVGSGAFLFAALNVLEPLYEACLERMSTLVEELDRSGEKHSPKKYTSFRKALAQVRLRPNEDYFIFKSIIVNNLYGVDIMEEAVEICKLRLFLKLASQVEPDASKENLGIEPLPDIDFNIRAGNTLVGFATREEVERSVNMGIGSASGKEKVQTDKLFAMPEENEQLKRIEEKAEDVDRLYKLFRQQQTEYGGEVNADDKKALQKRLSELEKELNILLARQYAIHNPKGEAYEKWLKSHTPFHWFVEFYSIMREGGFDIIIGNPPYVEYSKIRKEYKLQYFDTLSCGNLYAFVLERSFMLLSPKSNSGLGMIVPMSLVCTQRMQKIQEKISDCSREVWISNYAERPSKLFDGAEVLLTILLTRTGKGNAQTHTTGFTKWASEERSFLFGKTSYFSVPKKAKPHVLPKYGSVFEIDILRKMQQQNKNLEASFHPKTSYPVYYRIGGGRYWKIFTNFQPEFILNGKSSVSSRENHLYLDSEKERDVVITVLSSSLFYWYFILTTNGRDLNPSDLNEFPIDISSISKINIEKLFVLSKTLMKDYAKNSEMKNKKSSRTGNIIYQEFYPRQSKPTIDEIDRTLARHYGLSDDELDFIINYDVKYRMGKALDKKETKKPALVDESQVEIVPTDYGLYKCSECGSFFAGYEKDEHVRDVHGGQDVAWKQIGGDRK
jgi:hypothetical protein